MHIVIIGNGISGVSVAKSLREFSDAEITIVSSESISFFSRPALMYVFMGKMRFKDILPFPSDYWVRNKMKQVYGVVDEIDAENQKVCLDNGSVLHYDKLVLALGSQPKSLGLDEFKLEGIQGFYSLQDLEKLQDSAKKIKHASIIGGGLIGVELAEMFVSRGISFTFWVREKWFGSNFLPQEEAELVTNHLLSKNINIKFEIEIIGFEADGLNRVKSVESHSGEKSDTDLVCICIGVKPNVDWLKLTNVQINTGVLVNEHLQTNIASIYAVGDCVEFKNPVYGRKSIETLWYTGRLMGEYLGKNILHENPPPYEPGIYFNSAKFFDVEYQIYGDVPPSFSESYGTVFWKHPTKYKSIRLVYNATNKVFIGCCVLGIRFRQEVCEKWIKEKWKISEVLPLLSEANFDSEFSTRHEKEFMDIYNNTVI
jgi:3-phenylpropionate/trans-cinnamate dioxygenase ferredoxin reductase component